MSGSIWGFQARKDRVSATAARKGLLITRVNAHFEYRSDGTRVFYPLAEYGRRGYVVSSEEQQKTLRRRAWQFNIGVLIINIAVASSVGIAYQADLLRSLSWQIAIGTVGLIAMDWALSHLVFRGLTRNMTVSHTRNSPLAYWRSMGQTMNPLVLFLATSFLAIMAAVSLFVFVQQRSWLLFVCGLVFAVPVMIGGIALQSWWAARR